MQRTDISYALGMLLGKDLTSQLKADEISGEEFLCGFMETISAKNTDMTMQEASAILNPYMRQIANQKAMEAIQEGENFLAENAQKEGVIVRPSGLQYKIITAGSGRIPRQQNRVVAHYEGRLLNGKVFDSSYKRGQPATFPVGGLIPGWVEALQLMPVGSKWQLYIPSKLGYGANGAGGDIPPNATLIFDLELINIV